MKRAKGLSASTTTMFALIFAQKMCLHRERRRTEQGLSKNTAQYKVQLTLGIFIWNLKSKSWTRHRRCCNYKLLDQVGVSGAPQSYDNRKKHHISHSKLTFTRNGFVQSMCLSQRIRKIFAVGFYALPHVSVAFSETRIPAFSIRNFNTFQFSWDVAANLARFPDEKISDMSRVELA